MNLERLKDLIKDYGKDIRLNIESVLSPEGAPGLSETQILGVFLTAAYTSKSEKLAYLAEEITQGQLSGEELEGVKAASTIMGMNNIYYRTLHLLEGNDELKKLPAKLRMTVIGRPGIDKVNFEIYCLAASVITGCGMCINSHIHEVRKGGVDDLGIQSIIRIASVTHGATMALTIS